jgi:hypothetical protein
MNFLNMLLGIALMLGGVWLTIVQVKWYQKGIKDFSGGRIGLLICGIGLVSYGIITIVQHI